MKHFFTFLVLVVVVFGSADAQWKQCIQPYSASITTLSCMGTTLFASSKTGGMYRSLNSGEDWTAVNTGLGDFDILTILQNGDFVLAATRSGLYRSVNNGSSWQLACDASVIGNTMTIAMQHDAIFLLSPRGFFKSRDQGSTWTRILVLGKEHQITSAAVTDDDIYVSLPSLGSYKSTDSGVTWELIDSTNKYVSKIAVYGKTIITAGSTGLKKSTDNGKTWTPVFKNSQGAKIVKQIYTDKTSMYILFPGNALYRSSDNATTWNYIRIPNEVSSITTTNDSTVFASSDINGVGVYRTTNGGEEWTNANVGIANSVVSKFTGTNDSLLVVGDKLFFSHTNGEEYSERRIDYVPSIRSLIITNSIYLVQQLENVLISKSNGRYWEQPNSDAKVKKIIEKNNTLIAIGSAIYDTNKRIIRSSDEGKTWEKSATGLPKSITPEDVVSDGTMLYTAYKTNGIYRSSDDGQTWSPVNTQLLNSLNINTLVACPRVLFANTSTGRVFRSTDRGETWDEITAEHITTIRAVAVYSTSIVIGTYEGVFRSTDTGRTWSPISMGLMNLDIRDVGVLENTLYAGTGGAGLWKLDMKTLAVNEEVANTSHLTLYPNPTNSSITIDRASLPFTMGAVNYTILSVTGEKLLDVEQSETRFTLSVDGLPSGVYSLVARQGVMRSSGVFTVVR